MAKELFDLGDDLSGRLTDFCEALIGARKVHVVRKALMELINRELETNNQVRERYEAARAQRLGMRRGKLHVLTGGENDRT